MKASISDREALLAVSPAALSSYAHTSGWSRGADYRACSNVFEGNDLPEIIIPRTKDLGDYASVVSDLIEIFAETSGQDQTTVYRDLLTADRDVVRIRALDPDFAGSLPIGAGAELVGGARDIILAAACSVESPQAVYRPGANRVASEYVKRVRLGQTDQGSFVINLMSPVVSPAIQMALPAAPERSDDPFERRVTRRLIEALEAARQATDEKTRGVSNAFAEAVSQGVSANLCEALAALAEALFKLDISVVWARTIPTDENRRVVRFSSPDSPVLREASRIFRSREPALGVSIVGIVQRVTREQKESEGTVTLRTSDFVTSEHSAKRPRVS